MNRTAELAQGFKARLPSGTEWLTYAQCGDKRIYPWGNEWPPKYGNYSGLESAYPQKIGVCRDDYPVTCGVEQSGKNDGGLCGLGGNVWEWTDEVSGAPRLLRGASWCTPCGDAYLRNDGGISRQPSLRDFNVGFRVMILPEKPGKDGAVSSG